MTMKTQTPVVDAATAEIAGLAKEAAQNIGTFANETLAHVKQHIADNAKIYAFLVGGPAGLLVAHTVIESRKNRAQGEIEADGDKAAA